MALRWLYGIDENDAGAMEPPAIVSSQSLPQILGPIRGLIKGSDRRCLATPPAAGRRFLVDPAGKSVAAIAFWAGCAASYAATTGAGRTCS